MSPRNVHYQHELDDALAVGEDIEITGEGLPLKALVKAGSPRILLTGCVALLVVVLRDANPVIDIRGCRRATIRAHERSRPMVIACDTSMPQVWAYDDSEPTLVARGNTRAKLMADGRARPRIVARDLSFPVISAEPSTSPTVESWNGAQVMLTFSGDGTATAVAHDDSRIVITRLNKPDQVFRARTEGQAQ